MTRSSLVGAIAGLIALSSCSSPTSDKCAKDTHSASEVAGRQARASMHAGMDMAFSGDPDTDFMRAMIPHHQGAIDMARAELKYGRDPEIRTLALRIIKAQEAEVAQMRKWLSQRGVKVDAPLANPGERP